MDNYNGQNQFGQNQMNQNQYGQLQQAPQQQMYQQPQNYGNGYYNQPNFSQSKSTWWKWLLIIGVPAVVIGVTILIIVLLCSGYDIEKYSDVSKAANKTLNVEMDKVKDDMLGYYGDQYDIVDMATGRGELEKSDVSSRVQWIKFKNEKAAKKYYKEQVSELREDYNEDKSEFELKHWESDDDFTDAYLGKNGEIQEVIYILEDEYMVVLIIGGDKKDVEKAAEKFLDEID